LTRASVTLDPGRWTAQSAVHRTGQGKTSDDVARSIDISSKTAAPKSW